MYSYYAIDTETTGMKNPLPIEIAAVKLELPKQGDSLNSSTESFDSVLDLPTIFCERINTWGLIENGAIAVHGITKEDLKNCRSEEEVLRDFIHFLQASDTFIILIAHNAAYDRGVIERACARHELVLPIGLTWQCTMQMSRALDPFKRLKHTLKDCCERALVPYVNGHSALSDAEMCAKVFKFLMSDPLEQEYVMAMHEIYLQDIRILNELEQLRVQSLGYLNEEEVESKVF